jgi:hypothetical protein
METHATFRPLGEVVADDRARIAFGKTGVRKEDRYAVAVNDDGEILLTPLATIPRRELVVWENEQLRASLARGLEESATGNVVDLGDFGQFTDGEED